jgi:hypothetical protein
MYDHLLSKHLSGGGNALQLPSSNSTSILSSGESLSPQEDAQKQIPGTEKKQQDVKPSQQGRFQCELCNYK